MNVNHNKKGNTMRSTYIKRRIAVVILPLLLALVFWGGPTKAPINVFAKAYAVLTEPTFVCEQGEHTWTKGDKMWNVADVRCKGNITDATKQIMDDNGIKGKDLNSLIPGTIIVIKGGN